MWIQSIELSHYRNYDKASAHFSPTLNVFVGQNAQGKTNFLEAIYFLSLTRSHRTRHDKELINFTESQLSVKGIVNRSSGQVPLEILLSNKGRTTKVNHLKQSKLSDYIGNLTVVLFAPEDLQLVKGSPSLRRKFIDIDLGQMKPIYLSDLAQYHHVLKQRNSYLKQNEQVDETFLSVLDEQLADYGSRVILQRHEFIQQLSEAAALHHQFISDGREELTIHYQPSIKVDHLDNIRQVFLQELSNNRKRDLFKKNTGVGPHRDDMSFTINQMDASFGSQGQQRSLILSLKLAEIDLMQEMTGESPILLLDDVMSELDHTRQLKLLEGIRKQVQTFITTTSLEHLHELPSDLKCFHIHQGHIKEG